MVILMIVKGVKKKACISVSLATKNQSLLINAAALRKGRVPRVQFFNSDVAEDSFSGSNVLTAETINT